MSLQDVPRHFPSIPPPEGTESELIDWLKSQIKIHELVLHTILEAVIVTLPNGEITYVNAAAKRLLQLRQGERARENVFGLFFNASGNPCNRELAKFMRDQRCVTGYQVYIHSRGKKLAPIDLSLSCLVEEEETVRFIWTLQDRSLEIAQAKQIERQMRRLRKLASTDVLTGCYNRRLLNPLFRRIVQRAQSTGNRYGAIFIDIDGFKDINDRISYELGDRILKRTAETLLSTVRACDRVFRLGGDEFLVMLTARDASEIVQVATRILGLIREIEVKPSDLYSPATYLRASIGVAIFHKTIAPLSDVVWMAESLKTQAKVSGKNRIRFQEVDDDLEAGIR